MGTADASRAISVEKFSCDFTVISLWLHCHRVFGYISANGSTADLSFVSFRRFLTILVILLGPLLLYLNYYKLLSVIIPLYPRG